MLKEKCKGGRKLILSSSEKEIIRELIKENKYTLESIAKNYGFSRTYLYKYFNIRELRKEGNYERKTNQSW
ncbi:hypothetical protein BCU90_17450 [Vibrio lentus]|uniref:hypothetical protein n=1 Tax=Vibrio lentus TaxID=136468 RepID=UPI000C830A20|nr:hypothetical protein [Vibrio lentus]PMG45650.1 hypothetical protein BCU90_17450 [Vibrio lentus]